MSKREELREYIMTTPTNTNTKIFNQILDEVVLEEGGTPEEPDVYNKSYAAKWEYEEETKNMLFSFLPNNLMAIFDGGYEGISTAQWNRNLDNENMGEIFNYDDILGTWELLSNGKVKIIMAGELEIIGEKTRYEEFVIDILPDK